MRSFRLLSAVPFLLSTFLWGQSNPAPLIYQPLIPASIGPGHPAFLLKMHGTGFVSGVTIRANGTALKT